MKKIIKSLLFILFAIIYLGGCSLEPIIPEPQPVIPEVPTACAIALPSDAQYDVEDESSPSNLSINNIQNVSDSSVQIIACYVLNDEEISMSSSGFIVGKEENSNHSYTYYLSTSYSGIFYRYLKNADETFDILEDTEVIMDGSFEVIFGDGHRYTCTLVGTCDKIDCAIFKFQSDLIYNTVDFGNSDELAVGQEIYAIGTPTKGYDFINTIIRGNVSGLNRISNVYFQEYLNNVLYKGNVFSLPTFQFSASLNLGMEGGPVFTIDGKVVGVSAYRYGTQEGDSAYESLSFAIAINDYMSVANKIISEGSYTKPVLGVTVSDLVNNYQTVPWLLEKRIYFGLYIIENGVDSISAAGKANMKGNEVIVSVLSDNKEYAITNMSTLTSCLFRIDPSKPLVVKTIDSNGQENVYTLEF